VVKLKFKALTSHSETCSHIKNTKLDSGKDIAIPNHFAWVLAGRGDARIFKKFKK